MSSMFVLNFFNWKKIVVLIICIQLNIINLELKLSIASMLGFQDVKLGVYKYSRTRLYCTLGDVR